MKHLFAVALATFFSLSAQAGTWEYTCKSANRSILITRDNLQFQQNGKLIVLHNLDPNQTISQANTTLQFGQIKNEKTQGALKIKFVSQQRLIDSEDTACENDRNNHGPGHETSAFELDGQLIIEGQLPPTNVHLTCVEFFSWSGRCRFP